MTSNKIGLQPVVLVADESLGRVYEFKTKAEAYMWIKTHGSIGYYTVQDAYKKYLMEVPLNTKVIVEQEKGDASD